MANELGNRIKELRKKRGFTLEKLAELTDSSKSYIWELENKAPPRPSAEKLGKIADKLGVTLAHLLGDDETGSNIDPEDAHFYRNYLKKDPATRQKIRQMIQVWDDEG